MRPPRIAKASLGAIIQYSKSYDTWIKRLGAHIPNPTAWQRNCFDHIIRDERDWETHCGYILSNPSRWAEDEVFMDPGASARG